MFLYLAGNQWGGGLKSYLELYLAGTYSRPDCMDLYLAGESCYVNKKKYWQEQTNKYIANIKLLESFFYIKDWQIELIPKLKLFLLDSGAFSFMAGKVSTKVNWQEYAIKYANFIKQHNIKLYFELDIDSLVGIKEVERLRNLIEKNTGVPSIPVWHKSRGKDYFLGMVKDYNYIAIGGLVTKEIKRKEYGFLRWFIDKAHENKCKIHGLGFTNIQWLKLLPWDSVDSTSWTSGNRFGGVYMFNGKGIKKTAKQAGQKMVDVKKLAAHNFNEWVKLSNYLEGKNVLS